jgi:hypothetical protein
MKKIITFIVLAIISISASFAITPRDPKEKRVEYEEAVDVYVPDDMIMVTNTPINSTLIEITLEQFKKLAKTGEKTSLVLMKKDS